MTDEEFLPPVNQVGFAAPFNWLAGGLADFARAPGPCLVYGLAMAAISLGLLGALYVSHLAFWGFALTLGFVFVAPMLAMGLYEAGRELESGEQPRLGAMVCVCSAVRQDTCILGVALLIVFGFWVEMAQIVYGLSTSRAFSTLPAFVDFVLHSPEGHTMVIAGSIIGAIIAFFVFTLVVISAPMLLDRNANVFSAVITSFRAVIANFGPMLVWAAIIAALVALSAATGFVAMIVVFPWLGLASWRAYRALVVRPLQVLSAAVPA